MLQPLFPKEEKKNLTQLFLRMFNIVRKRSCYCGGKNAVDFLLVFIDYLILMQIVTTALKELVYQALNI